MKGKIEMYGFYPLTKGRYSQNKDTRSSYEVYEILYNHIIKTDKNSSETIKRLSQLSIEILSEDYNKRKLVSMAPFDRQYGGLQNHKIIDLLQYIFEKQAYIEEDIAKNISVGNIMSYGFLNLDMGRNQEEKDFLKNILHSFFYLFEFRILVKIWSNNINFIVAALHEDDLYEELISHELKR